MPAHKPEELDELFAQALNSGDLDALVALYEPQACLEHQPGQVATGSQAIREALTGLLAMSPKITLERIAGLFPFLMEGYNWVLLLPWDRPSMVPRFRMLASVHQ